jgi:hypothetical protein
MADKQLRSSKNQKKKGKSLQEKRMAKRQKRAEHQAAERAREISTGEA